MTAVSSNRGGGLAGLADSDLATLGANAVIERVTDHLLALVASDDTLAVARKQYETKRGKVHQAEELWESWSAAFVEWLVFEPALSATPVAASAAARWREARQYNAADVAIALANSHRSLFEIVELSPSRVEVVDLLGGAEFSVREDRGLAGVNAGDVAELRLVAVAGEVYFGKTAIYHPRAARDEIVAVASEVMGKGGTRFDAVNSIATLRAYVDRYRHLPVAKVYRMADKLGS